MLVVPTDGAPIITVPGPSDVGDMRERAPWIADLRCEPSATTAGWHGWRWSSAASGARRA